MELFRIVERQLLLTLVEGRGPNIPYSSKAVHWASIEDFTQPDRMMEIIEEIKACGNVFFITASAATYYIQWKVCTRLFWAKRSAFNLKQRYCYSAKSFCFHYLLLTDRWNKHFVKSYLVWSNLSVMKSES